ncbi:MAG: 3-dehydroquinate synthase [Pseudohongiellaceae bacterium]
MISVNVDLGSRSYPIFIGRGLLDQAGLLSPCLNSRKILIVTNETVAPLYLHQLRANLADTECYDLVLPDGEQFKTLATVGAIYDKLMSLKCDRGTTLIALGGGVIGDIAGFAAATYQRGVNYIQIPTTLLAQVDSSVGGKTGVNHPQGKNMIGAFHQPRCVVVDISVLDSLPVREFRAGLAEVLKYGLIRDSEFFDWLEQHRDGIESRDSNLLAQAIKASCEQKAAVVALDERESGVRALLNLGHTFGHAIETATGYGNWLHGEAVATGMVMAADISRRMGWLEDADAVRVKSVIRGFGLPVTPPAEIDESIYLNLMSSDKKVRDGKIRLVLLKSIGEAVIEENVDAGLLRATLKAGEALCES